MTRVRAELQRFAGRLLATGKIVDGLTLAKQIADDAPKSPGAAALLSRAYRANGQRLEAIQALSKSIELSPTPRALLLEMEEMRQLSNLQPK